MLLATCILIFFTLAGIAGIFRYSDLGKSRIFGALIGGVSLFLILHLFLYSIGKTLSIDLIFFDVRIIGKNALENLEQQYLGFVEMLGVTSPLLYGISFLIVPACIEEMGKWLTLVHIERKNPTIRNTSDAVFSMIAIALWFAFAETFAYLWTAHQQWATLSELARVATFRSILSTASHVAFSTIVGFFYGRALFAGFTIIDHGGITRYNTWLKWIKKHRYIPISSIKTLYRAKLYSLGFSIATVLHIAYNYAIHMGHIPVAYVLIVGSSLGFYQYTRQLAKKECDYLEIDNRIEYLASLKKRTSPRKN